MSDVKLKGTLHGIEAALPIFLPQESGHVFSMRSVAGPTVAAPGGVVYSGNNEANRTCKAGRTIACSSPAACPP